MTKEFDDAFAALQENQELFNAGQRSSVEHSRHREAALVTALRAIALELGVTLQSPLAIDSRGEFHLVAMPADGSSPQYGTGPFGEAFAGLLNRYQPRTGINPGATLLPENGWCRLNHFAAEKLVQDWAQQPHHD